MTEAERPSASNQPRRLAVAGRSSSGLPPDLEAAAARRLGALALVVAVVALAIVVITQLVGVATGLPPVTRLTFAALDVLLSVALYLAIARGGIEPRKALDLGFAYQVAHGFLSAIVFHALTLVPGISVRGWTPVAVWLVIYPLVVPSKPGRVWLATVATAAMDPLAIVTALALGAHRPPDAELVQMLFPTALATLLAPIAARIVYGLTVEVKKARDMGSYRLVEKLGEGGMGEVWRAEHRMLARGAAIKLIRPAALGAADAGRAREMVKRFEREAQATAALRSPHTIEVYDYGVAGDSTFHYVMELLEGYSLQVLVDRFGPVPPGRAVRLLRQACHSLAEAHANGLVHRDVKPANMFVCRLGLDLDFVKVLDFGLVKLQGAVARDAEALTVEGAFTGTPAYMPPEVALGAEVVDGRADLYALGCVAYWLLTGHRVFETGNAMQMVVDHVRTRPSPPSERTRLAIPPALEAIVLRCLEKDPERRPATASDLSRELAALGIEGTWTEEHAAAWWKDHAPQPSAPASGTKPVDDASRGVTRSGWDLSSTGTGVHSAT